MHIENFKGFSLYDITFGPNRTIVIGENGTGKTSLNDAWHWVMTGTDSAGSSAFTVQPLDKDSNIVDHLTTMVVAVVSIDGQRHEFKRTLEQKWTKPRGKAEAVKGGNESAYYIDDVPQKQSDYYKRVAELVCEQEDFRLMVSVTAFNKMDTSDKRRKLIEMAGQLPDILNAKDYPLLCAEMATLGSIDQVQEKYKFQKKNALAEKELIPAKITENERNMPTDDFDALRDELTGVETQIAEIDAELQKTSAGRAEAYKAVQEKQKAVAEAGSELNRIESLLLSKRSQLATAAQNAVNAARSKFEERKSKRAGLDREAEQLQKEIDRLEAKRKELAAKWMDKNKEQFQNTAVKVCPTCKRPFTDEEYAAITDELIKTFNAAKSSVLKQIAEEGNVVAADIAERKSRLAAIATEREVADGLVAESQKEVSKAEEAARAVPSIEELRATSDDFRKALEKRDALSSELKASVDSEKPDDGSDELSGRKVTLQNRQHQLITALAREQDIERVNKRREELEQLDGEYAAIVDKCDKVLYEIQQYRKAHILAVENTVSAMFKLVRWKMYEQNLTNDGEREICQCLVNGVPYDLNLNTGAKINSGVDIAAAFSKWRQISVPLFIDNAESVDAVMQTHQQVILLQKKKGTRPVAVYSAE